LTYAATDTDRRLANVIQIGRVKAVDAATGLAQVDLDGPDTDWIPWTTLRAGGDRTWWAPEVGEQVLIAAPSGELGNAVIIGSLYQDAHPEPASALTVHKTIYADGTVVKYDRASHTLLADLGDSQIKVDRSEVLLQVGSVKISVTASGITLVGNLTIDGTGGGTATVNMDGNFAITGTTLTHNGKSIGSTHAHSGVQTGAGNTGQPV